MVFISRLKLRNFKSFKAADIQLPKTFICFAGPNGSGKSNLCDAIRFAMGEKSLRSLRAKGVKDLIHTGARSAEVTLQFASEDGGSGYEIRRAIREDGKIRYRLNEKKTTRMAILEALKRHNLDESGRNTIAQGEVQRLINMNGKERRGIIDSVAGIADFEEKKKEALGELSLVETRIKEAKLVLGERHAFLEELGKEKETAIAYQEAKRTLSSAKGTLLRIEMKKLEKELSDAIAAEGKAESARVAREAESSAIEAEIANVDSERGKTSQEMQAKQKTNALIRRLEELKASCASRKQLIADRSDFAAGVRAEIAGMGTEAAAAREAMTGLERELAKLKHELGEAEKALVAEGGPSESAEVHSARRSAEEAQKGVAALRERTAFLKAEAEAKAQLAGAKREEFKSLASKTDGGEAEAGEDMAALRRDAERLAREIDRSFGRTKEINVQVADIDRQMLELKEKASIFKVRTSPQLANPALSFIADMMKDPRSGKGIHGTVADLISFDDEDGSAVEAAGGSRLLYVVVDSVETATETIGKLKAAKAGRATFIPLDSIRTPPAAKAGGFSSVMERITYREEVRRAVEYVFADTLLVGTVQDARKIGVGSTRMVTAEGEIFERSGIVSGGRTQGSLLNANQLRKIESELSDMKSSKDGLIAQLYSIREEESRMRAEKAQIEIRLKTAEMRRKLDDERRKENEAAYRRKEQLGSEIAALEQSSRAAAEEAGKLASEMAAAAKAAEEARMRLEAGEAEQRRLNQKTSQRREELSGRVSSLRATIEGKLSQAELRKGEAAAMEERRRKLERDEREALGKAEEAGKALKDEEGELARTEERITTASKEIEQLFERMRAYEDRLAELGKKRGAQRIELERIQRDMNQLTVKKATSATRLEDIKAEFSSYADAEVLELGRDELGKMVAEAERTLASLGNVNMAAIEMFDRRKAEIDEVEERIGKLDTEREAILSMISEIDEHKKDAFFEAFNSISENFSKMFGYINVGQGHLHLSDPASPFESGLFIKLRRNNQEHALDALSGGEKTLVALMFIFALQLFKPAPFYILDEVDAALDKPNSKNLADLVAKMSDQSQFIVVSHNDTVMSNSESVIGVTKAEGVSKLVGIKLRQVVAQT